MADYRNIQARTSAGVRVDAGIDQGLRSYMLKVYNLMGIGLAVTGLAALALVYLTTTNDPSLAAATAAERQDADKLRRCLLYLAVEMARDARTACRSVLPEFSYRKDVGIGSSNYLLGLCSPCWCFDVVDLPRVTPASIARTFFITAASFGALTLWGYTTKRDISGWGSFLFMGLIGIILAMIVNIFLALDRAAVRDLRHRRADLRGPYRL